MPQRVQFDGVVHTFPDDFTQADIAKALQSHSMYKANQEAAGPTDAAPTGPLGEDVSSGGATAAVTAARSIPALTRSAAGFVASHPAAAQKIIGAGVSTIAGGIGGAMGGVPGAVVGASIRGVTPAQATIRQIAGQAAGETPAVATNAARALGIQNYAKELSGLKIKPTDIIPKPNAANAIEHYANSMERGILRLYGPNGEVVSGPSAVGELATKKAPGVVLKAASKVGKVMPWLQAASGITDLAQTIEPNRHDIGIMGIGATHHVPGEHPAVLNALIDALKKRISSR